MIKCALLFPGQASQYVGMGEKIWNCYKAADRVFEEAQDILHLDIKALCKSKDDLQMTKYAQICIFVCSAACYQALVAETGYRFQFFAGHSVGEYAALACSGSLDFKSALLLVKERGEIMGKAEKPGFYAMANVRNVNSGILSDICEGLSSDSEMVNLICDNSVNQKIIAGSAELVNCAISELEKMGVCGRIINSLGAFHTSYMNEAQKEFNEYLRMQEFRKTPSIIMSNVTGRPYLNENHIYPLLSKQMTSTVLWSHSLEYLRSKDVNCFIEVGAGTILRNMLKQVNTKEKAVSIDAIDNIAEVFQYFQ